MRKILIIALIACTGAALTAQTPRPGDTQRTPASTQKATKPASPQPRGSSVAPSTKPTSLAPAKPAAGNQTASPRGSASQTRTTTATPSSTNRPRTTTGTTRTTTARPNNATKTTAAPKIGRRGRIIPATPVKINWMTLEEALEKSKTEKRKIFIDVYTDWCGWCKRMNDSTFADPFVAQYLNDHYYPVKFNAEYQQDIVFKDKVYRFKRNGARGYHELAAEWLNNRLSYPTVVFLDENLGVIQPIPGFQDPAKMEAILTYFGTNSHYTVPWETFEKRYAAGE